MYKFSGARAWSICVFPLWLSALVSAQSVPPTYVEGEAIVYLHTAKKNAVQQHFQKNRMTVSRTLNRGQGQSSTYLLIRSDDNVPNLMKKLRESPDVVEVAPNFIRHPYVVPNDPLFADQWGLQNTAQVGGVAGADIRAANAWETSTGSSGTVLAVLDSGVDYTHEDLAANMWHNLQETPGDGLDNDGNGYMDDIHGIDTGESDSDPMDETGHGTQVAGVMAAVGNNEKGIAGVNWQARILPVKIEDADGNFTDSAIIEALSYVTALKQRGVPVRAMNASWGGNDYSQPLKRAIEEAGEAGILLVVAAGNGGYSNDEVANYPSSYDLWNVISVAASKTDDQLASFSNYGRTTVDLAAPGEWIASTAMGRLYHPAPGDIFFDDMESGTNGWAVTPYWAITDEKAYDGSAAWSDSPGGPYLHDHEATLTYTNDIDLSSYASTEVHLGFATRHDYFYRTDGCRVYASGNAGASWTELHNFDGQHTLGWEEVSFRIPDELKTSAFRFKFWTHAHSIAPQDGIYIDRIGIGVIAPGGSDNYAYSEGTSLAAPFVTGVAGLLQTRSDIINLPDKMAAGQVKSCLLSGTDELPGGIPEVLTDGRMNAAKALESGLRPFIYTDEQVGLEAGEPIIRVQGCRFGAETGQVVQISVPSGPLDILSWSDEELVFQLQSTSARPTITVAVQSADGIESIPFDVTSGIFWEDADNLPFAAGYSAAVSYKDHIYVLSDEGPVPNTNHSFAIYDTVTETWSEGVPAPYPGPGNPYDGAVGLDDSGEPVILFFPSFSWGAQTNRIFRYRIHDANWDSVPLPGNFPAQQLIEHDMVSLLTHTGDNVCYLTGGQSRDSSGVDNHRWLWEYRPDSNTMQFLGDFTHVDSFWEHASFFVPWIGKRGAICVVGGVGYDDGEYHSDGFRDTQCYDIHAGVFRLPNTDIPPLPTPIKQAADLQLGHALWIAGGKHNGNSSARTYALTPNDTYWKHDSKLFLSVSECEGVAANGDLYVCGGWYYSTRTWFTQRLPLSKRNAYVDDDGDGMVNADEIAAGTDAMNSNHVFSAVIQTTELQQHTVSWPSYWNRVYDIEISTNLVTMPFTNLVSDIPCTPPMNVWTSNIPTPKIFIRTRVRQAPLP